MSNETQTERDELRERVAAALHDFWRDVYVFEYGDGRQKQPSVAVTADRIIALVEAARDAEIRDALLSEGAVDAQRRYYDWQEEINQYMNDIATMEANADRIWQAMDESTRGKYAMDWSTDPSEPRLIGKAFTAKARQFKWPKGHIFETVSLRRIDPYLRRELNEAIPEPVVLGEEPGW